MEHQGKQATGAGNGKAFDRNFFDDLFRGNLFHYLRRDLHELYHFYLDEQRRRELAGMGQVKRGFYVVVWIVKELFLRLSPARRALVFIAMGLMLLSSFSWTIGRVRIEMDFPALSFTLLLLVLLLELKDKLLARDELQVGRAVQLSLLPSGNPVLPGWEIWLFTRPANDVGGDLVDYLFLESSRLAVTLGDVAGKGLGAALLMAKLQSTIRAIAPSHEALSDLGAQLNRILCRDGLPNRFATLLYAELRPAAGRVRLLNAGHIPPVILRPEGRESLPPVAVPLGILPRESFEEQGVELQPGDVLLAFSDGLTDARNPAGELFEEVGLERVLAGLRELDAAAIGTRLVGEVDLFLAGERGEDDLSLLILKKM